MNTVLIVAAHAVCLPRLGYHLQCSLPRSEPSSLSIGNNHHAACGEEKEG